MKVKKYQNPSGSLTKRKRRLFYFTPEQEKQFNQVTVPGTNVNSNATDARKTGVQAQNFQAQEAARKDAEIEARSDRKTIKRQTTVGERLRGDNGYSSYMSAGTPMSGRDPALGTIFDWTVGAKGIDALGKTALWNFAKYGPSNQFRGLARNYFINNAFKQELRKPIQFGVGETLQPQIRTRLGDVEINNPGLNYRVGTKEIVKDFQNSGVVRAGEVNSQKPNRAGRFLLTKQTFQAPMFKQGSLWYQPSEKMNGLLVTSEPLVVANKYASPIANKGIFTIEGKTFANDFGGRRIPAEGQILNKSNTTAYTWSPGYGYKQVVEEPLTSLKFFERKPSKISEAERLGIPKGERNQPFKSKQPTEHVQGEEAVKMFKEYGGEPIPEGSINGEQLRKYVPEARERYGLVGNNNITDEEIAQALYKHSKELGGNTAAINAQGEPQLLFRGDTRRYMQLKERMSPEELAKKSGTMDNSLGNLFLGEFPYSWRGVDRYIGTWRNFNGSPRLVGSGTGSKVVWDGKTASEIEGYPYLGPQAGGGYKLYSQPHRYGNIDVYKLPASMMESGVNDLNAFIVRTPQMRNASSEISVLNDDWMLQGAKDSHFMSKNYKYNPKTYSMENVKTGESLGEITTESAPESRAAMGDHYKELLKEAEQKQQGLLKSEANAPLRDEHSQYSYFALPNFNIQGAKHLLPYDLRIPRNWKDKNIYRGLIPLAGGYTLSKKSGGKLIINNTRLK